MAERFFILDGMAFAFRSYFAIRNLRDSKGRPTNAVFGFARVLLKLLREHEPSHIVVTFDAPGKTFRDDMYPAYKANRDETPQDLIAQFPVIDRLVEAFGIPILRVSGVEADDVMGALSRRAEEQGMDCVLVSGDICAHKTCGAYDINYVFPLELLPDTSGLRFGTQRTRSNISKAAFDAIQRQLPAKANLQPFVPLTRHGILLDDSIPCPRVWPGNTLEGPLVSLSQLTSGGAGHISAVLLGGRGGPLWIFY